MKAILECESFMWSRTSEKYFELTCGLLACASMETLHVKAPTVGKPIVRTCKV